MPRPAPPPGRDSLVRIHPEPGRPHGWSDRYFIEGGSLHAIVTRYSRYAHGRLLDIGVGEGPYAEYFRDRVTAYIGFDYPLNRYRKGTCDVSGSSLHLPFRTGIFDTVVSTQVLEHVPDPARMLQEIRRVLAPDGHLILTAPQTWGRHEEPHDYFRFTSHGLRHLCRIADLEIVDLVQRGGFFAMTGQRFVSHVHERLRGGMLAGAASLVTNILSVAMDRWSGPQWHIDTLGYALVARPAVPTAGPPAQDLGGP